MSDEIKILRIELIQALEDLLDYMKTTHENEQAITSIEKRIAELNILINAGPVKT